MDNEDELEHYINDPVINRLTAPENKLYRPKINYTKAAMLAILFCILCFMVSYVIAIIRQSDDTGLLDTEKLSYTTKIYPVVFLVALIAFSRFVLIWFVRLYQRYASAETRLLCCYTPSCSEYTILALKKYGTFIGGIKSIRRLLRCKEPGGIDYP